MDLLNREPEVKDLPGAKKLNVGKGEVVFEGVSFGYGAKTGVIRDLSLTIHAGERLALVGRSGAGKSTVVKLLLRLFNLETGVIRIDGQSIHKVTQASLREAVSYVPQEPLLFHRSILENIRYGKPNTTEKEVIAASKKAFCHEFIKKLPNGYDSLVGERGVKLSGGERQRVAIARAILKDAPILVLDEATSSLDPESEQYIQAAMAKLMEQKTVLVIAHRLSTIRHMDRVIVMDGGKIVDEGTHDVLLRKDSIYRDFWKRQTEGYKAD
jgi:ATP-binding cassette subfamily B protein